MNRRLPIYIVVETSNEMRGDGIVAANQAIRTLIADLKTDPTALEVAYLSTITFADQADQVCPLTELFEFESPILEASGSPDLGLALSKLSDSIDREVVKSSPNTKGDYKPVALLISTGITLPGWQAAAEAIKSKHTCNLIALQVDTDNGTSVLRDVTEQIVDLQRLELGVLRNFFKWTSVAIGVSSLEVETSRPMALPPPPANIQIVATEAPSSPPVESSESLLMLLGKGADLNARSKDGETPLHSAVRAGNRAGIEVLLAGSAAIDLPNNDGDTPLLLAVKLGRDEIAAVLIRNGADVNARDKNGLTALHYAAERKGRG